MMTSRIRTRASGTRGLRFAGLIGPDCPAPSRGLAGVLWVACCCLMVMGVLAGEQRGVAPQYGIGNFGKVNEHLYRGAQPDAAGIRSLKELGIRTIINLRMTNDVLLAEAAEAQTNGIVYTNVPLAGLGRPTDVQVNTVLALIQKAEAPVFIHCEHGCDRTGTIIACYRIKHDHWSVEDALQEAEHYGMSKLERGMKRYIEDFGKSAK